MLDFSYTKVAGGSPIPIVRLYFKNPNDNLLTDSNDSGIIDTGSDITVVSYTVVSKLQLRPLQMKKDFIFRGLGRVSVAIVRTILGGSGEESYPAIKIQSYKRKRLFNG